VTQDDARPSPGPRNAAAKPADPAGLATQLIQPADDYQRFFLFGPAKRPQEHT
jgi:hypothetical protein